MKKFITSVAFAALMATSLPVMAQTATDTVVPGHPRVSEVDQRLENQEKRTEAGVDAGTISAKQEAKDVKVDDRVSTELSKDEAKNGGKITKAEQRRMNKQLNHNSKRIHHQRKAGAAAAVTTK